MRYWYDEEHDMKMCEPDCVDELLFDIWAIGHDYDGCHNTKDLKALIDELVSMANKARECLWERRLFGSHGEPKPQTNAEVAREWIPVTERFPDQFVSVLGYMIDAGNFPPVRECYLVGKAFYFPELCDVHPVSHWMPLPEPPKGE